MSEYFIGIYNDPEAALLVGGRVSTAHQEFMAKHAAALRGGAALAGAETATTIRPETGITDGVFAETKEVFGGYYLIEAPDLDAALAIAADVPTFGGGVEVRPVAIRS